MKTGTELELSIERLATGGEGVARAPDGRVVFVPLSAPGDRLRARVTESRRSFARAEPVELLEPGAGRVEPRCPLFGECGGCSWQHLSSEVQLDAKVGILRDALVRIARLPPPSEIPVHASPSPFGYRGCARVVVTGGEVGFRQRRSHSLCAARRCPVLVPGLDDALARLAAAPPKKEGEWELVAGDDGAVRAGPVGAPAAGASPTLRAEPEGQVLRLSPGAFAQANVLLRGEMARRVLDACATGDRALELYAGAGFLTLGLAGRYGQLVAVESSAPALRDLRANLQTAGLRNVRVVGEPVERFLRRGTSEPAPELVLLDPPRCGLARATAGVLAGLAARRIVYLSCDPATLARDLTALAAANYELRSVEVFDLFPQTPHVETLAILERGQS